MKRTWTRAEKSLFAAPILIFLLLAGCRATPTPIVTAEEFEKVQVGMTYAEVAAVVGAPAGPSVQAPLIYVWQNPDRSTLICWFQNGKLTEKLMTLAID